MTDASNTTILGVTFVAASGELATIAASLYLEKLRGLKWTGWLPFDIAILGPLSYYCIAEGIGWFATAVVFSIICLSQITIGYDLATRILPDEYAYPTGVESLVRLYLLLFGIAAVYAFLIFQAVWIPTLLLRRH